MSGIIDKFGQWERCNGCGNFVLIQHLRYEPPSKEHEYGRDLCSNCAKGKPTEPGTITIVLQK